MTTGSAEAGWRSLTLLLTLLAVPGGLLWIFLEALRAGVGGRLAMLLAGGAVTWLAAGVCLLAFRRSAAGARAIRRFNLVMLSSMLCWLILEAAISIMIPVCRFGVARFLRGPNLRLTITSNTEAVPGQTLTTTFSTNDLGLRGQPSAAARGAYRILAIGGSTTESYYLDDSAAWPHLLEQQLSTAQRRAVWIQNAGISGHTTADHLLMMRSSPVTEDADLILVLAGVNDLSAALAFEGRTSQRAVRQDAELAFGLFPLYSRSAVIKLSRLLLADTSMRYVDASFFETRRQFRRNARTAALPPLDLSVREYGARVQAIADECVVRQKRCVLMTQPTLWRTHMTRQEIDATWLGWVGPLEHPTGFAAPADLQRAMDRFNEEMVAVGRRAGVEVFDLAARIPKTLAAFTDDCHFTAEGAKGVAESVAAYLLAHDFNVSN